MTLDHHQHTFNRANCGPLNAVRGRLSSVLEESEEFAEMDAVTSLSAALMPLLQLPTIPPPAPLPEAAALVPVAFLGFLVLGPAIERATDDNMINIAIGHVAMEWAKKSWDDIERDKVPKNERETDLK